MTIELECKIPVPDLAALRAPLTALGAKEESAVHEKNWLFDLENQTLQKSQTLLRLRTHDKEPWGILTCKHPTTQTAFKSRLETEVHVADHKAMRKILTGLGYQEYWFYEKKRETWLYFDCEIVLDHTPEIGCFIEIEARDPDCIEKTLIALGLNAADHLDESYLGLWKNHCAKKGQVFCDMRFV